MAGVGKTALAVHAAHRMRPRFPDGQLFVKLHGYTAHVPRVEPAAALDRLLRSLGVPGGQIPEQLDDRAALYRDRLAGKQMLVLLDDAYSADQIRPLLPGAAGSLVLVTSRRRLAALDDAYPISLDSLPVTDAVTLFTRVAGPGRITGQHEAVERITGLCGGLPLAIRIAAARLRNHPVWQARQLADRLADARAQPAELDDGERSISAAFTLSYQDLTTEQRRMFRLLALLPGRDVDAHAAAALAECGLSRAGRLLKDLLDAHLLTQEVEDRYRFHNLMRAYAADLAAAEDTADDRRAALTRLLDQQRYTAAAAADRLFPHEHNHRPPVPLPASPVPAFGNHALARAWLDAEWVNLVAAAGHAAEHGWPTHARDLATTLSRYLSTTAHYAEALALHGHALHAAQQHGDRSAEGAALGYLGDTYRRLGHNEQALQHLRLALAAHRETGDRVAEAITLKNLGIVHGVQGRYEQALEHLRRALVIDRTAGNQANEANTLSNLANVQSLCGRYDEALYHYQLALAIFAETGNRAGEGTVLSNLGNLHEHRGHYQEALDHLRQALDIFAETGDRASQGTALTTLGEVQTRRERYDIALDHHQQALRTFRAIGDRPGQGEALAHLGSTYAALRRFAEARDAYTQALALAREVGNRTLQTIAINGLGHTLRETGHPDHALAQHQTALTLATRLGNRYEQARALDGIAAALDTHGDHDTAHQHWQQALAIYTDLGVPEADHLRSRLPATETQQPPPPEPNVSEPTTGSRG
jgi:tetratricopeptide (TPR) repeat protein